jgi:hypothetical protein
MSITLTTNLTEAMKIIFAEPLVVNVVEDSELVDLFKTDMNVKSEETTGGRYIEMAHYFQLPAGVGARAENEYIPVPDPAVFKNSRIYLKKLMGTVEMTGDVMRKVTGSEGAFLDYMNRALPDLVTRLVSEVDRMYIGYGAGIKARVNMGTPSTSLVIDSSLGVAGYEDAWVLFMEGESLIMSPNANSSSPRSGVAKVTDINESTNTLTIDSLPTSTADNDYIFSGDAAGSSGQASGVDREIAGLLAAVDDGTILGTYNNINRATAGNRLWKSIVIDASVSPWGGQITEDLLHYADDEVAVRGAGRTNVLVMSRSAARGYWKSLKGDRFFVDPKSYAGGESGLSILLGDRTLAMRVARKLPPQVVFGLQTDTFRRITLGTWEWDDRTGSIWNRVTDATGRKDAFYATGLMYEQLFCTAPRKNFRIDGLTRAQ